MKLYYFPLSTYSHKVMMACREKGIDYEPMLTDLRDEDERARYRELYPLGKVPLLVLDDGHMIPESSIIIEYLDTHFDSGPRLIPEDPDAARRTRFNDRMLDLYLDESVATLTFEGWKPEEARNHEAIEKARFRIDVMYRFLDESLGDREWLVDDAFTMADIAAAPPLFYAREMAPFAGRANIEAYWKRLSARPSWGAIEEEMAPYLEWMRQQAGAA